jgi:hypothetical protein
MLTKVQIFTVMYCKLQKLRYDRRLLRIDLISGNVFDLVN